MWDEIVGAQSCQEKRGGRRNRTESKHVRALKGEDRRGLRGGGGDGEEGGGHRKRTHHISAI